MDFYFLHFLNISLIHIDCKFRQDCEAVKDLSATLHFNKASALWKLSCKSADAYNENQSSSSNEHCIGDDLDSHSDSDAILSEKLFELQRCEQACLSALDFSPRHIKAFFRLISVMIALGRPKEALDKIISMRISGPSSVLADENFDKILTDLTRKCNASLILRAGTDFHDSRDPEAIASSILSSGAAVSARTAKMLARLNTRRLREDEGCSHAWRGWDPPLETESRSERVDSELLMESEADHTHEARIQTIFQSLDINESVSEKSEKVDALKPIKIKHSKLISGEKMLSISTGKSKINSTGGKTIQASKKEEFMRMMKGL